MTYYCNISKESEDMFVVRFPDMPNVITYGKTKEHALQMAKEALEGVLETDVEHNLDIPDSVYRGGFPIEVDPRIAHDVESWRDEEENRRHYVEELRNEVNALKADIEEGRKSVFDNVDSMFAELEK